MKTKTLLLFGAMTLLPALSKATIYRVNSVPVFATTCATCYQTLPSAIAAAIDGDTIHLEPADANYGDAVIAKRLVIIGAGYKLGVSPNNDSLQANTQSSRVNLITLNSGSEGTKLMGLHFVNSNGGLTINSTSQIQILRNFFDGEGILFPAAMTVSDITVAENFFNGAGMTNSSNAQTITNQTIRNNYISGQISIGDAGDVVTNTVITNNTLNYNGNHVLKNAEVSYNVFNIGNVTGTNITVHDNISAGPLPAGTNNDVVPMGNVFNLLVGTDDSKWNIVASSPYDEAQVEARGHVQWHLTLQAQRYPGDPHDLHAAVYAEHLARWHRERDVEHPLQQLNGHAAQNPMACVHGRDRPHAGTERRHRARGVLDRSGPRHRCEHRLHDRRRPGSTRDPVADQHGRI
ncbi:MAG: hypothetical protein IPK99_13495 [Flavobacteriales bacterium]|nr:hypothetical protein [Flavobacteriales bacterium]